MIYMSNKVGNKMCHPREQNFSPIKHAPKCTFQEISQGATESDN